jgi:hypothetical protein
VGVGNCAGIDWASEKHDVLIADGAGDQLLAETFAHDEQGVGAVGAPRTRLCRAMPRSIVGRRDSPGAASRSSLPRRGPARTPAALVWWLQGAVGNAAVARMVAPRRTLARTLNEKVQITKLEGQVTLAKLREIQAKLESAWSDLSADAVQASFVDKPERVAAWREDLDPRLDALLEEINKSSPADPEQVGMTMEEITARATPLAERFYAVVVTLSNVRGAINRAWDAWNSDRTERQSKLAEEAEFAYKPVKEEKDYRRKEEKPSPGKTEEEEVEDDEEGPVGFPHKGKHAPRKKWLGKGGKEAPANWPNRVLEEATASKGATAAYKTQDVRRVLEWEDEARCNGLELYGTPEALKRREGFTIVYGFGEEVGADHGEMTRFVRIDGDHGHPIIESHQSLNTSFTAYVKKEVEVAKGAGDIARLKQIWDFLTKLHVRAAGFGLKSEPKLPETVKQ